LSDDSPVLYESAGVMRPTHAPWIVPVAGALTRPNGERSVSRSAPGFRQGTEAVSSIKGMLVAAYNTFNARDIEAVLAVLHRDLNWRNGLEGGVLPVLCPGCRSPVPSDTPKCPWCGRNVTPTRRSTPAAKREPGGILILEATDLTHAI
jgi:hypothetical protein